jgi:hypothetical protein
MATYRLNVIFHGPFLFVFYKHRLEVLGAEIEEHVVGVGNWKEERPCDAGTYRLRGFKNKAKPAPPSRKTHGDTHVIIDAEGIPDMKIAQDGYYRFILPLPCLMQALGLVTPKEKSFFIVDEAHTKHVTTPTCLGSAHVLSYEIDPTDRPHFYNLPWVPHRTRDRKLLLPVTNVHIFSESPFALDDLHPNRDFNLSMQMLPGLLLDIVEPFPKVNFKPDETARKLGICDEEQGGLRGLPPPPPPENPSELVPPRICDAPSLVVNAS